MVLICLRIKSYVEMKEIYFVTDSLKSGGAERVMSILANEFVNMGYRITILSKAKIFPFYELDEKIEMIYPSKKINYQNKISTFLGRCHLYVEIFQILKKKSPDLVITFSTTTNGSVIPICKILGIPVIASEHTNYRVNIHSFFIHIIKRYIYPKANILTVLTERDRADYYSKFMKNVVVMPNPLPLTPNRNIVENREDIILAVGGISRWKIKGFDNLLKIFSKISTHYPNWKLMIAGAGAPNKLESLISEYHLEKNVSLLGEVRDIQSLMRTTSIFVLTSRWEGLPMVLIEAMSQGMACIAYDCFTGPGDILTNNKDGILVEDQNQDEFITKLSGLIQSKEKRIQLGLQAIETSKNYLPSKIIEQWKKLIEDIDINS